MDLSHGKFMTRQVMFRNFSDNVRFVLEFLSRIILLVLCYTSVFPLHVALRYGDLAQPLEQ